MNSDYLRRLDQALTAAGIPGRVRRRIVTEAAHHLQDSPTSAERPEHRFGEPGALAHEHRWVLMSHGLARILDEIHLAYATVAALVFAAPGVLSLTNAWPAPHTHRVVPVLLIAIGASLGFLAIGVHNVIHRDARRTQTEWRPHLVLLSTTSGATVISSLLSLSSGVLVWTLLERDGLPHWWTLGIVVGASLTVANAAALLVTYARLRRWSNALLVAPNSVVTDLQVLARLAVDPDSEASSVATNRTGWRRVLRYLEVAFFSSGWGFVVTAPFWVYEASTWRLLAVGIVPVVLLSDRQRGKRDTERAHSTARSH